jgi:hypothetical protein
MTGLKKRKHLSTTKVVVSKRAPAKKRVLVAKPAKRPIDYASLRKSTMKRFGKTLAYLAK